MSEELIVALNKYFEGYELKRGDALKAAEAIEQLSAELEREKEKHQHTSEVAFAYEEEIKQLKQVLKLVNRTRQSMNDIAQDFQQQLHDTQDERDAAVADLESVCKDSGDACHLCKHLPCAEKHGRCIGWEWRGVAKENAERARGCELCNVEVYKNAMIEDCGYTVCPMCGRPLKGEQDD